MMEQELKGASLRDRATAVEPVPVSPLRDGIPSALAFTAAEDLIALAEHAYEAEADMDDAPLEDACCTAPVDLCGWRTCHEIGCIIDKYHRGLALQAQAMSARQGQDAERLEAKPASAVPNGDAPNG